MGSRHSIFDRDQLNLQPRAARMCGLNTPSPYEHPSRDGIAPDAARFCDFLFFTRMVESLESGPLLSFGSAIMGPDVFLTALAMARTIANRQDRSIRQFTNAAFRVFRGHCTSSPAFRVALIGRSCA